MIRVVQQAGNIGTGASLAATFAANATVGNYVIAMASIVANAGSTGMSNISGLGSSGFAFTPTPNAQYYNFVGATVSTTLNGATFFIAPVVTAGTVVTATFGASVTSAMTVIEVSGLASYWAGFGSSSQQTSGATVGCSQGPTVWNPVLGVTLGNNGGSVPLVPLLGPWQNLAPQGVSGLQHQAAYQIITIPTTSYISVTYTTGTSAQPSTAVVGGTLGLPDAPAWIRRFNSSNVRPMWVKA